MAESDTTTDETNNVTTDENRTTLPVNYLKRRMHSPPFTWSQQLDQNLLRCYEKAKDYPSIGCINRLKQFWDEARPHLNTLTAKQLRQQASFVK